MNAPAYNPAQFLFGRPADVESEAPEASRITTGSLGGFAFGPLMSSSAPARFVPLSRPPQAAKLAPSGKLSRSFHSFGVRWAATDWSPHVVRAFCGAYTLEVVEPKRGGRCTSATLTDAKGDTYPLDTKGRRYSGDVARGALVKLLWLFLRIEFLTGPRETVRGGGL